MSIVHCMAVLHAMEQVQVQPLARQPQRQASTGYLAGSKLHGCTPVGVHHKAAATLPHQLPASRGLARVDQLLQTCRQMMQADAAKTQTALQLRQRTCGRLFPAGRRRRRLRASPPPPWPRERPPAALPPLLRACR